MTTTIPAFHVFYADTAEVDAVSTWLDAHDLWAVSANHDIRVDDTPDGPAITFEAPCPGFTRHGRTYTRTVPCVTPPPLIAAEPRPDLHDLLLEHAPAQFPLFSTELGCQACTPAAKTFVPWRCPTVVAAIGAQAQSAA